jgi:hypothetical protein
MTLRTSTRLRSLYALGVVALLAGPLAASRADLPAKLSDEQFWQASESLSEAHGSFRSDNLLSNETGMQVVIPELTARLGTGGVYLGVGPEQNFTYIAALKPRMVFIVDVRRGNRDLHLMYKALFEMSADRAEFVSRLFSRPKPEGLTRQATAAELFAAYDAVSASETAYRDNLAAITEWLVKKHKLPLSAEEIGGIEYVYSNFYRFGPGITYSSSSNGRSGQGATYATLMQATDGAGVNRSYLSSDETFRVVKDLETANLLVPVVGNFSGPKALRAVGAWVRERGATVSAFYLSNVEDYLSRDGTWLDFCRNVASLPLTETSTFIRSGRGYFGAGAPAPTPAFGQMTIQTNPPGGGTATSLRFVTVGGLGGNRLGLMSDDLKPCAAPGGAQNR